MTTGESAGAIFIREATSEQVNLYNSAVGLVQAEAAELKTVAAGAVITAAGTTAEQTVAGILAAGNNLNLNQGIASIVAAGNTINFSQGGGTAFLAGNSINIDRGGGAIMMAGAVKAQKSFFGIVIAGAVKLEEDSRVLLSTPQAVGLGAALGVSFAVASRLLRRCCR